MGMGLHVRIDCKCQFLQIFGAAVICKCRFLQIFSAAVIYKSRFLQIFGAAVICMLSDCFLLGLYRYRLGDAVKVVGFHNSTPELKFVCRRNLLLTIDIDKNTEKDLQLAVEAAATLLGEEKLDVVDFSSHADSSTDPGHYVIFWEINGVASEEVLQECCNCLDRSFIDAGYVSSRKVKTIGALELRVLRRGTFQKILDHYLGLGAAVSQFKTPRCVGPTNNLVLQILCANVVKSYFSTAF